MWREKSVCMIQIHHQCTITYHCFWPRHKYSGMDSLWIVIFLSAVWTLILTAPIHCRGSIAEQVMECYISPNLFWCKLFLGWTVPLIINLKIINYCGTASYTACFEAWVISDWIWSNYSLKLHKKQVYEVFLVDCIFRFCCIFVYWILIWFSAYSFFWETQKIKSKNTFLKISSLCSTLRKKTTPV